MSFARTPAGEGASTVLDRDRRLFVGDRTDGGDELFALAVDADQLLYGYPGGIGLVGPRPPPFR